MLNWSKLVFITGISFFFIGCKKSTERSCFKSSGKLVSTIIDQGYFNILRLHPYVDYELIQDTTNYVEISCGENLFPFIDVAVKDSILTISNKNKCRFLRDYDKSVKAKIHLSSLFNIYYDGTGSLISLDTISASFFTLKIEDSAGEVNLIVKSEVLSVYKTNAAGLLVLSGKTNKARYENTSLNKFDVSNLEVRDSVFFLNQGYGHMYLYTKLINVYGRIEGVGNVYYKGLPALTQVQSLGKGKFIEQD
jgi:hypothetical protein